MCIRDRSMAAPHVAGVAAMIFGIDPSFTAKEVKDIIVSTATGSYGSVKEQYPLLNARMAVEKAIKLRNKKAKGQIEDVYKRQQYILLSVVTCSLYHYWFMAVCLLYTSPYSTTIFSLKFYCQFSYRSREISPKAKKFRK